MLQNVEYEKNLLSQSLFILENEWKEMFKLIHFLVQQFLWLNDDQITLIEEKIQNGIYKKI